MKMNKILLTFVVGILLISMTSAALLGPFRMYEDVKLPQTCDDCTYNMITSIQKPDGEILIFNEIMQKNGTFYNWTLDGNNVDQLGVYFVNGVGDLAALDTVWSYDFEVKKTGRSNADVWITLVITILLLGFIYGVVYRRNKFMGSIAFLISGVALMWIEPIISFAGLIIILTSIALLVIDLLPNKKNDSYGQWIRR